MVKSIEKNVINGRIGKWLMAILLVAAIITLIANGSVTYAMVYQNKIGIKENRDEVREVRDAISQIPEQMRSMREDISDIKTDTWRIWQEVRSDE